MSIPAQRVASLGSEPRFSADGQRSAPVRPKDLRVAGIVHDFNNVLAIIQGFNEVLLISLSDADPNRPLALEVARGAKRGAELCRQLLAEARDEIALRAATDLGEVVAAAVASIRRLIGDGIILTIQRDPGLGRVLVRSGYLERMVVNLCLNARDAMPDGGRLTIRLENAYLCGGLARDGGECQPGPYVCLAVSDTGFEMSPAVRAPLFEPFFTTKSQGTGLGLATTLTSVRTDGGYISVESEEGVGSTFRVYLPLSANTDDSGRRPRRM